MGLGFSPLVDDEYGYAPWPAGGPRVDEYGYAVFLSEGESESSESGESESSESGESESALVQLWFGDRFSEITKK